MNLEVPTHFLHPQPFCCSYFSFYLTVLPLALFLEVVDYTAVLVIFGGLILSPSDSLGRWCNCALSVRFFVGRLEVDLPAFSGSADAFVLTWWSQSSGQILSTWSMIKLPLPPFSLGPDGHPEWCCSACSAFSRTSRMAQGFWDLQSLQRDPGYSCIVPKGRTSERALFVFLFTSQLDWVVLLLRVKNREIRIKISNLFAPVNYWKKPLQNKNRSHNF